jgi:hypothetical protein
MAHSGMHEMPPRYKNRTSTLLASERQIQFAAKMFFWTNV